MSSYTVFLGVFLTTRFGICILECTNTPSDKRILFVDCSHSFWLVQNVSTDGYSSLPPVRPAVALHPSRYEVLLMPF
ncbi:hypothetical protein CgunFtcFv8_018229 [Champsocephalus gunnari]|uniref:Secreted protein n=1 Tax=Champsocephalus gunnari TaxID=52237 RepID=A0AAN8DP89_CHAGU|nr:hypothetical protein CgunFtcFv8_018229 [Champsocephalus gunnari]